MTGKIGYCRNELFTGSVCDPITAAPVQEVLAFHRELDNYKPTPLYRLNGLADNLGLNSVYVKDESQRFGLNAYKALGGYYAVAHRLNDFFNTCSLNPDALHASRFGADADDIVFTTMTDGNHGMGVAWVAQQLGYKAHIYVPEEMVEARREAIRTTGAEITVFPGAYDDAARKMASDAEKNGRIIIADTAWDGYTEIPQLIIDGYTTLFEECRQQMPEIVPTHIFIQAGVGSLAASLIRYYRSTYPYEHIQIITTEPEKACCFYESCCRGGRESVIYSGTVETIMSGLACAEPNPIAWPLIRDGAQHMMICHDTVAEEGMQRYFNPLADDPQIISGESGAVTLGLLEQLCTNNSYDDIRAELDLNENSVVLLINTEGDTDPVNFDRITGRSVNV